MNHHSLPCPPARPKRKHASPITIQHQPSTSFPSSLHESHRNKQQRPTHSSPHMLRPGHAPSSLAVDQPSCMEPPVDDALFSRQFDYEDPQELACCSSSMTTLGRFGVWHPEESVFKEGPKHLFSLPGEEELKAMYKLPRRRPKQREDGPGGVLLFPMTRPIQSSPASGSARVRANIMEHDQNEASISTSEHTAAGESLKWDETFDEADEDLKFSDLRTVDDAIKYFSEPQSRVPVELVYCNRVSSGKEFSPYNLVIVPRANVEPEHFIISATGIVHVEPGSGLLQLLIVMSSTPTA